MKVSFLIISQNLLKESWAERARATHKSTNHYLYIANFPNFLTSEKLATERKRFYLFLGINHEHCLHSHTEKSYLRPVQKHKITICLNKGLVNLTLRHCSDSELMLHVFQFHFKRTTFYFYGNHCALD